MAVKGKSTRSTGLPIDYKDGFKDSEKVNLHWNRPFFDFFQRTTKAKVITLWGGAGSGKSRAILMWLVMLLSSYNHLRMLVARQYAAELRMTTYQMLLDILEESGLQGYQAMLSPMEVRFKNNIIWFTGLDRAERRMSLNVNHIYIEEATEVNEQDYLKILLRLRHPNRTGYSNKMFLSFNPVDENHWTNRLVIQDTGDKSIAVMHSTYSDNEFLDEDYKERLRNLERVNPNFYRIYTLGEFGLAEHLIYPHWTTADEGQIPRANDCEALAYGLDFGFNNPSALVEVRYSGGKFYLLERLYESHLTNTELTAKISHLKWTGAPIFCDAAEPARIAELQRAGLNAYPAEKATVIDGVDYIRSQNLVISDKSKNLIGEIRSYQYRLDKKEIRLEEPMKGNDHLMDAMRYAMYSLRTGKGLPPDLKQDIKVPSLPSLRFKGKATKRIPGL